MLIPHTEYRTAGHIPNGPVVKEVTIRFFIFFPRRIINDLKSYNGRRHLAGATVFLCQSMGVCYFSRSDLSCFLFYGDYFPQSMHKWKTLLFLVSFHIFPSFAALPKSGPEITGGHLRYNPNDLVNVTCTTKESKPAAQLHWMINGEPADPKYVKGPYKQFVGREGLETTSLSKPTLLVICIMFTLNL